MNNSMIALRFTVFLLYISILLTGCHSYFEVSKKDYVNLDKMNDIKIVYKDGKELIVEKDDTTNAKIIEDSIVVYQGTNTKTIAKSDVEKIRESRFDFGRTLSLVVGTVVGFLLTVSLFIWAMGGVNLAGWKSEVFYENHKPDFTNYSLLVSISILLTGCHSYFEVFKKDYINLEKMNDIKIVYKDGKEFIVEKDDTTNAKIIENSLVVFQGTNTKTIAMSDVEKIRESRFDLGGTITVSVVLLTFFLVLFFSSDPLKT